MTVVSQTLLAVMDSFQRKEGVWRSTLPMSYFQLKKTLEASQVSFAEWDPQRGLYFLDFSPPGSTLITMDVLLLDFRGERGSDHFRFEWTQEAVLVGVELQTHAPGPLPFVPEISQWLTLARSDASPALTMEAWSYYLEELAPQTPVL